MLSVTCLKFARQGLLLTLLTASSAMAQSAIIPDENTPYPDDITTQPAIISQCMGCHGPGGVSLIPDWPSLAGQPAEYLESQLNAFKSGQRSDDMMNIVARGLSAEDIKVVASYFSQRRLSVSSENLPEPPVQASTCIACHGPVGISLAPEWPSLAGQKQVYLLKQLIAFKTGARKNDVMYEFTKNLGEDEMTRLADYYSAFEVTIK